MSTWERPEATAQQVADAVTKAIAEVQARRAQRSPDTKSFARDFRHFPLDSPWFHIIWYDALDDPSLTRIYLTAPREHAKTSAVLTWALRLLADHHHIRIGIISGSDPLAMKFLNELKHELATNERLRDVYNGGASFVGDKWTEHELTLADARSSDACGDGTCAHHPLQGKDVSVFAVGRGGQVSSRHCDVLIVDDVESKDSTDSDTVRADTREWWAREVIPVVSKGGKIVVLGTRKHFDDLYAYLIKDPTWVKLDAAKSVWREPDAIDDGTPIWAEMWDRATLRLRKRQLDEVDVLAWPQEYLNAPRPSENQMLDPNSWPRRAPKPGLTVFQYWDLAISEKETADYTVGFTIGVDEHNNVDILEQRRGHWDFNRQMAEIQQMGEFWQRMEYVTLATIGIEDVAYQAAAVQEALRRTMLPIVPESRNKVPGAKKNTYPDKVTRARLLEARARAGKVFRPAVDPPWWANFVAEAVVFPDGSHDDQIDALGGAVRLAGFEASTIGWAYGVWTCVKCGHMFLHEAKRPCPKCGTLAPEVFENPEGDVMGFMAGTAA